MKNLLVYKANEVIEAGYKLTLNELRVVLACIAQVNSSEELLETDEFELSAKDFAAIFEVSQDESYRALIDVTESLFNRYVVIENPDSLRPHPKKAKRLRTRWISGIRYYPDEGGLSLRFAQDMLPYLSGLKNAFTRYRLEHVGRMTSIYAMRLYELLAQWQSVVDVNLTGMFLCLRQAFRVMKAQSPMGGRIINNGSISATTPRPNSIAYTATKHAVTGLTKSASLDGRKYGIAVGQIDIGNAATDMTQRMTTGILQANGELSVEPVMDVAIVGQSVLYMAGLPLQANVMFHTVMATKMPFAGRG